MDKHQDHNKMDHNNKNHSKMDHSSMNHAGGHAGHHTMMIKDFKKRFLKKHKKEIRKYQSFSSSLIR